MTRCERLYEATPAGDRRTGRTRGRTGADNELGAWYVTTEITRRRRRPAGRAAGRGRRTTSRSPGVPMMNGSATVEGFVPRRDATVVTRLLAAGATIAGKAVCEDLCFSGGSHTSRTGPVRNPWDRSRSAGGSSSGSAALVAAGQADLALGGDQGGSIRIPSAFCGTVGHKPTLRPGAATPARSRSRTPSTTWARSPRTVRDAALLLGVLAGPDGLDPRQRARPAAGDYLASLDAGAAGLRIGVRRGGLRHPRPLPARGGRDRPRRHRRAGRGGRRGRPASASRGTATACTSGTSSPPTASSAR